MGESNTLLPFAKVGFELKHERVEIGDFTRTHFDKDFDRRDFVFDLSAIGVNKNIFNTRDPRNDLLEANGEAFDFAFRNDVIVEVDSDDGHKIKTKEKGVPCYWELI